MHEYVTMCMCVCMCMNIIILEYVNLLSVHSRRESVSFYILPTNLHTRFMSTVSRLRVHVYLLQVYAHGKMHKLKTVQIVHLT